MGSKALALLEGLTRWWGSKRAVTTADFQSMAIVLLSGKGEASGVALASRLLAAYGSLPRVDQHRFFDLLATRFGPNLETMQRAAADFLESPDSESAAHLHDVAEPRARS
jgi:malonyl-CoA decarboxylase